MQVIARMRHNKVTAKHYKPVKSPHRTDRQTDGWTSKTHNAAYEGHSKTVTDKSSILKPA